MLENKIEQKEWIFYNIEKHSQLDYYKIEDLYSHKYANRVDFHSNAYLFKNKNFLLLETFDKEY